MTDPQHGPTTGRPASPPARYTPTLDRRASDRPAERPEERSTVPRAAPSASPPPATMPSPSSDVAEGVRRAWPLIEWLLARPRSAAVLVALLSGVAGREVGVRSIDAEVKALRLSDSVHVVRIAGLDSGARVRQGQILALRDTLAAIRADVAEIRTAVAALVAMQCDDMRERAPRRHAERCQRPRETIPPHYLPPAVPALRAPVTPPDVRDPLALPLFGLAPGARDDAIPTLDPA